MSREDCARLADIVARIDAARRAESLLERAEAAGDREGAEVALDAIRYDLVVIGEAVKHLSSTVVAARPDVPWRSIAGMRDVLAHAYFDVSARVVRATLDAPLRELREACSGLLGDDPHGGSGS